MSRVHFGKIIKRSFGSTLYRTVCILLVVTMLTAWSVSGVYAKYVSASDWDGAAGVANFGITQFELTKYGVTVDGIDYSKVVPGADIPGPHIKLHSESEVSYTLYLRVTATNFNTAMDAEGTKIKDLITFTVLDNVWYLDKTETKDGDTVVYTYKYIVKVDGDTKDFVFKPTVEYDFTGNSEIKVLQDDVIYVSERFSDLYRANDDNWDFKLAFETYIQQVLSN